MAEFKALSKNDAFDFFLKDEKVFNPQKDIGLFWFGFVTERFVSVFVSFCVSVSV